MTKTGLALALWTLGTAAAGAAPCSPSPAALCLSGGRFEVKATWKDFQGNTGQGQAVAITADTGYFWFFYDTNIELIVKVLDARALNGKFWVFFGALSNVEYDLTVTDSSTGASKTYHNPSGQFASVGDTSAFAGSAFAPASREMPGLREVARLPVCFEFARLRSRFSTGVGRRRRPLRPAPAPPTEPSFVRRALPHLRDHWTGLRRATKWLRSGVLAWHGRTRATFCLFQTSRTYRATWSRSWTPGALNGEFWVFFGALSNVEYTIKVVDTVQRCPALLPKTRQSTSRLRRQTRRPSDGGPHLCPGGRLALRLQYGHRRRRGDRSPVPRLTARSSRCGFRPGRSSRTRRSR